MSKFIDLTGQTFGRLIVVERATNSNTGKVRWLCKCECGGVIVAFSCNLGSGYTRSCGCYRQEKSRAMHIIHGDNCRGKESARLYRIWRGMRGRCKYDTQISYPHYGGRGIQVCLEWLNSYPAFRDWATSHGYADNLSIDRKDVNGNYTPDNCQWVTEKQQCNNRRSNVTYDLNGESKTIAEWADIYGVNDSFLRQRVCRDGLSLKDALTRPVRRCSHG